MAFCLARASELLGEEAHAVNLDFDVQAELRPKLRFEVRTGFTAAPSMNYDDSARGHSLHVGMERYRLVADGVEIPLAFVSLPYQADVDDFWAVRARDRVRLYRFVRRLVRRRIEPAPLLPEATARRLWDNTIGFLRNNRELLRKYGVVAKRGVLLLGSPGNGKTMACRHLRAQCLRRGLSWRTVTPSEFATACADGEANELFQPERAGIVLFDDCDALLAARGSAGLEATQTTLLGQLDGVSTRHDVVYLFTSNMAVDGIDFALRRPGRIDVVLNFPAPDGGLRRRLIAERWHEDLRAAIDADEVAADTEGLSFAELEEARKLLVLGFIENARWDWPAVREALRARSRDVRPRRAIGFAASCQPSNSADAAVSARAAFTAR